MNTEQWEILSAWHNAWLTAPPADRDALRASLAASHPQLLQAGDDLTAAGAAAADGFLETPALVLAAQALATDDPILAEGTAVGPYRIIELLARGGMGDVYRAHDPRLGRDVALKTLTPTGRLDDKALERFLHEARVTASLDHPNIVCVFDVGTADGRPYLITELLDGGTLLDVIRRGTVPIPDVRAIASALASGLAAAHARGLIHRDLKPENILVTRAGGVKIVDFGIAKLTHDPAIPQGVATLTGVILGTAGYLAPEQIKGEAVDARADLFALGSILFELITGRRAFARDHTIDTLHAIVHDDPPDLLPPNDAVASVVRRLLAKSPDARFQSAADLLWVLERLETGDAARVSEPSKRARGAARFRRPRIGWAVASAAAITLVLTALPGGRLFREASDAVPAGLTWFTWSPPEAAALDSAPVVSPDGARIALVAQDPDGTRLFVRSLDSLEAVAIDGTEGARQPFWSPDGTSIGFFARGKLMKVALDGGVPVVIADAPDARGGAWSANGTIVFTPDLIFSGLVRVSANGGQVTPVTLLDLDQGENSHRWPAFLPDGVHFLFHVKGVNDERRGVYIGSIDRAPATPGAPLFRSESEAIFVATADPRRGVLLSAADGRLHARPFDATTRTVLGDPRTLPVPAGANTPYHSGTFSATTTLLASLESPMPYGVRLGIVSRNGSDLSLSPYRQQSWPRLSPDGWHMARQIIDPVRGNPDVWIEDLRDGSLVRVTSEASIDVLPVWSPDGRRIAYGTGTRTERRLSVAAADGTGVLEELPCPATYCEPTDWSPDGRELIVNTRTSMSARPGDIWRISLGPDKVRQAILAGTFPEYDARLSPDGQWLAYVSEETGSPEVSVRAMSGPPRRLVASSGGGSQPVWRRDGRELLYVDLGGRLQARSLHQRATGDLEFGVGTRVDVPVIGSGHWGTQYDVSADGRRIYFIDRTPLGKPTTMNVLLSWQRLLAAK